MNRFLLHGLLVACAPFLLSALPALAQPDVTVSVGGFYDELSPYGQWVSCAYGRCWVPAHVAPGWQPYSNGQWIYTDYGWTWASNDPWGGTPYHYGTWTWIHGYGWSWVPGTVWAPAWVTWSYNDQYIGWAPIPPTVVFSSSGYSGAPVVVRETHYVFVPTTHFVGVQVSTVRLSRARRAEVIRSARPATVFVVSGGVVRNQGVPMRTIERASGQRVVTANVQVARTAPHPISPDHRHVRVVAPAREMKAAAAGRPPPAERAMDPRYMRGKAPPPSARQQGKPTSHTNDKSDAHDASSQQRPPPHGSSSGHHK